MKATPLKTGVCVLALVWAVAFAAPAVGADMDEVRVALMYEPSTVNILEMKLAIDITVILPMHEMLISADPETGDRTLENSLSESIEVLPNNKSIKVRLRKNAVFHTGDPVTAHDVKFTYEQVANPRNTNMMAGPVDEIEAIVQRKIHTTPALRARDLHVRLGARGSVCFVFEGVEYESLEDMPNLTAQQLVRDAITEWDERV